MRSLANTCRVVRWLAGGLMLPRQSVGSMADYVVD